MKLIDAGFLLKQDLAGSEDPEAPQEDQETEEAATTKTNRILVAEGNASYYANRFHGRRTASGENFNQRNYTAAHRSLPFGTRVRVTNLANGRHVVVKVNDRGPHKRNRIIDISQAAADDLGLTGNGVGHVRIEAYN